MQRLRFGTFLAPFHPPGQNPTLAIHRDLELVEHLDALGYDEAWIGEHHSAGSEIIASPEIFIAAAAERTRHIKLGTGVSRRSRTTIRCGWPTGWCCWTTSPGAAHARRRTRLVADRLVHDRADPDRHPRAAGRNLDIIVRLLRGETVTQNDPDAQPAWTPGYSFGPTRIRASTSRSPPSRRRPGRGGRSTRPRAAVHRRDPDPGRLRRARAPLERGPGAGRRTTVSPRADRAGWRLVGLMHVAETREQAYRDVEYGIAHWFHYFQKVAAFPQMAVGDSAACAA